jgi:hypothetical protein
MRLAKRGWWDQVIYAAIVIAIVAIVWWIDQRKERFQRERSGFRELGGLMALMIERDKPGVRDLEGMKYVASFSAFFEFVKRTRPEIAWRMDDPNPFPGILPGKSYGRIEKDAVYPSELMFLSNDEHDQGGTMWFRLACDGTIMSQKMIDQGYRVGSP